MSDRFDAPTDPAEAAHHDNRNLPAIVDERLDLRRAVEVESVGIATRRGSPGGARRPAT